MKTNDLFNDDLFDLDETIMSEINVTENVTGRKICNNKITVEVTDYDYEDHGYYGIDLTMYMDVYMNNIKIFDSLMLKDKLCNMIIDSYDEDIEYYLTNDDEIIDFLGYKDLDPENYKNEDGSWNYDDISEIYFDEDYYNTQVEEYVDQYINDELIYEYFSDITIKEFIDILKGDMFKIKNGYEYGYDTVNYLQYISDDLKNMDIKYFESLYNYDYILVEIDDYEEEPGYIRFDFNGLKYNVDDEKDINDFSVVDEYISEYIIEDLYVYINKDLLKDIEYLEGINILLQNITFSDMVKHIKINKKDYIYKIED